MESLQPPFVVSKQISRLRSETDGFMADAYQVLVWQEESYWLADISGVQGAHTFARSIFSLRRSVQDVIRLMDDLDCDAPIELAISFAFEDDLLKEAVEVEQQRRHSKERQDMRRMTANVADRLVERGLSVRDVAALLGISFSRVAQLTKARRRDAEEYCSF